jgi:hypothetical protein
VVDLAYSYDIREKLLDARTAPSSHAAQAAPVASVNAGHANAIAREVFFRLDKTKLRSGQGMVNHLEKCRDAKKRIFSAVTNKHDFFPWSR